jgi:hypothetical protein
MSTPRRKWVWDSEAIDSRDGSKGCLVEVDPATYRAVRNDSAMVIPDTPGYQSPASGLWVEGRKQRREDFKRTGSRPFEGVQQEKAEAARRLRYAEERSDRKLDESVRRAYHQMSPAQRAVLEGRRK